MDAPLSSSGSAARRRRPRHTRRLRSGWRWVWRGLALLVLLPLLLAGAAAGALWWSLPTREATLTLPGLSAPVEVAFDTHGIPRLRAANERDAAMALGLLHARDRMFQMELMRRGAAGRLAELAGGAALRSDRLVRTLGLARRAREDLATLPPETRGVLEAYATGVNAWIAARGRFAAPEFIALGAPEPWAPEHSLLWGKIMGLWLSGNWREELDRARLATLLPPERLAALTPEDHTPGRPDQAVPERGAFRDEGHLARLAAALPRFPEPFTLPGSASNAWAVTGAHSASGAPLLANDPHLGFQAPILWYLARVELPGGRFLAGATAPGVPFMVIGRNESLAWGFTTTTSDTQDVFVERLAGEGSYAAPGGPLPFAERREVIGLRGDAPVPLRVRETRHGPVISDLDAEPPRDTVLAVAMANLAPGDTAAAGLQALNRARSLEAAREAAALITTPSQNLMVAEASPGGGRIGLFLTGRTPLRRAGDGTLPVPGWDGSHDWLGWVPFAELPHVVAPETGVLANANNRVAPPDHPVFLAHDWPADWRFRRIGQLLGAAPRQDAAGFAAMQMDTVSLFARAALAEDGVLRRLPRPSGAAGQALDLLLAWDGDARADRPEPLIFNAFARQLGRLALAAGGVPPGAWEARSRFLLGLLSPGADAAAWCAGDCAALAGRALDAAVADLAASQGPDPAAWRWGALHRARFEHPLLRAIPLLRDWARREVPTGGDAETVARGGMGPGSFTHVHGAGLRLVADLAAPAGIRAIIATGQSGHPLSAHWADLLPLWQAGGTVSLGPEAPAEGGRLSLRP
ncbi:penicillin acylase family protein [Siccirubricoccus sp. KC 17139]|uniref:Penicillin acylase family protein n=1 Tax=Siccirubricoccus soli TaxID=2899147 RepID=A0ABT1D1D4_9PROT|nr:penicillin acylase family protein [Siccirubricoccus soli]MCO6415708.1 penicillin acylase family protein [Siccirubricoccus soli]MCP2681840.1 penicillin acylase family protein [Siccirubricoccus soli]